MEFTMKNIAHYTSRNHWTVLLAITIVICLYPVPSFQPIQIIYGTTILPALLSPFTLLLTISAISSRVLQFAALAKYFPMESTSLYTLHLVTIIPRVAVGWIFNRGVGWKYPFLFIHSAGYEPISGLGLSLLILSLRTQQQQHDAAPLLLFAICFLDRAPWAYTCALVVGLCWRVAEEWFSKNATELPMAAKARPQVTIRNTVEIGLKHASAIACAAALVVFTTNSPSIDLGSSNHPIMSIVVISAPRPIPTLEETIRSYIPILSPKISLSAYTRSPVPDKLFTNTPEKISEFVDFIHDKRPEKQKASLYVDAAGLFEWVHQFKTGSEWVMIVEDDFVLCDGPRGRDSILGVLSYLESSRLKNQSEWPRAGWIGTGGSGLIFHRSILPTVAHLLRTPSPAELKPPADLIMQACALSADNLGCGKSGAVISSRLAMRHIGGGGNSAMHHDTGKDKWQCGWRHPAHGRKDVAHVVDI